MTNGPLRPKGKHDSTRLERRMRHEGAWPLPKDSPTCQRCCDAGWFTRKGNVCGEFTFACDCQAGESAPKGLPRWREPKERERMPEAPPAARRDAAAGRDED